MMEQDGMDGREHGAPDMPHEDDILELGEEHRVPDDDVLELGEEHRLPNDVLELGDEHHVPDADAPDHVPDPDEAIDDGSGGEKDHAPGLTPIDRDHQEPAAIEIGADGRPAIVTDAAAADDGHRLDVRMDEIVVSDQALIRWLETARGVDMTAARKALAKGIGREPTETEMIGLIARHVDVESAKDALLRRLDGCRVEASEAEGRCECIDDHGMTFTFDHAGAVPHLLTVTPPHA